MHWLERKSFFLLERNILEKKKLQFFNYVDPAVDYYKLFYPLMGVTWRNLKSYSMNLYWKWTSFMNFFQGYWVLYINLSVSKLHNLLFYFDSFGTIIFSHLLSAYNPSVPYFIVVIFLYCVHCPFKSFH